MIVIVALPLYSTSDLLVDIDPPVLFDTVILYLVTVGVSLPG
jgi:hypothetical protein